MEVGFRSGTILLGKYRIENVLGRGGMGVVLRVTHLHLDEELAIKVLLPEATSPEGHARFLREAQSVVRLRGEHVTRVIDVGILPEGAPYMVMEHLRGLDLADELRRRSTFTPGEAVDYVLQACEALAEAHANGIIHRDIKPGNLFLTKRPDGTPLIKVLDFGISKAPIGARGVLTRTESVMGTPGYMSPEQMKAAKDVDERTDIWAIGVVLYEFLTGRRPFDAEAYSAVVLMAATEPPPPIDRRVPRGLQAAVLRCLEKQRDARFPSVAELAAALAPFARDQRTAAMIADRTRAMSRGACAAIEHASGPAQSPTATTLSGGAGESQLRPRRRSYAIIGATSLLALLVGLSAAIVGGSGRSAPTIAAVTVEGRAPSPGTGEAREAAVAAPAQVEPPAQVERPAIEAVDAAPDGRPEDEQRAQIEACDGHKAQGRWQALEECAGTLARLGAADAATEFHITARRERANEHAAHRLRGALRAGHLKKARGHLAEIDTSSVYFAAVRDEIDRAEAAATETAKRTAESHAKGRKCTQLAQYVAELRDASTERVAAAAQAVACVAEQPPASAASAPTTACAAMDVSATMAQAERHHNAGRAKEALGLVTRALGCRQETSMFQAAVMYACSARDEATARRYLAKAPVVFLPILEEHCKQNNVALGTPGAATRTPAPASPACDGVDVDELMQAASSQFNAGYAKSSLQLLLRALACRQDPRTLRFAVMYACAAHDLAIAKQYFVKVPQAYQASLEQKCQQEGLNLRGP